MTSNQNNTYHGWLIVFSYLLINAIRNTTSSNKVYWSAAYLHIDVVEGILTQNIQLKIISKILVVVSQQVIFVLFILSHSKNIHSDLWNV